MFPASPVFFEKTGHPYHDKILLEQGKRSLLLKLHRIYLENTLKYTKC